MIRLEISNLPFHAKGVSERERESVIAYKTTGLDVIPWLVFYRTQSQKICRHSIISSFV